MTVFVCRCKIIVKNIESKLTSEEEREGERERKRERREKEGGKKRE